VSDELERVWKEVVMEFDLRNGGEPWQFSVRVIGILLRIQLPAF
jgi:hypothetical protein